MLRMRGNRLTWVGHATFRITTPSGQVVFIDPWLEGNPACPTELKKPDRVDTMLITHGHRDHFDDVLPLAKQFQPEIVAIIETGAWLKSKGCTKVNAMNKGGTVKVGDIEATMVNAVHSNGIDDDRNIVYGGDPAAFVVKLPGGMTIYHAGDTAVFGDMKTVIHDFHKANLAVINLGPNPGMFQSGAYAINDLLKPASVIFTHVNEAATEGGKLKPNTQTAALMKQVKAPAYLAISERTMEFNDKGKCVSGC